MTNLNLRQTTALTALTASLIGAGLVTAPAIAQTTAAATSDDPTEVIVTATRRSEKQLAIPYNISAVSGDAIDKTKVQDSAELLRSVPGVSLVDRGYRNQGVQNSVVIRGINVDSAALGDYVVSSVSPVSTYVNDTPLFANFLLRDLDRVEILRGPQGTLYGSGSLGGTIRYITKAPKLGVYEGRLSAGASSVDGSDSLGYSADAVMNLPLGDTLALRLNLSRLDLPGITDYVNLYKLDANGIPVAPNGVYDPAATYYTKKDADYVKINYGRAALKWEPNDIFDATLSYATQSDKVGGRRQETTGVDGYGHPYGKYQNGSVQLEPSSRKVEMTALEANIDLGFATLTSSTSYYDHSGESVSENTGFYAKAGFLSFYYNYPRPMASAIRGYDDKALTEELRLVSAAGGNFDWVAGVFYKRENLEATQESYLRGFKRWYDAPSIVVTDQDFAYDRKETFTDTAVFGELTWHVNDRAQITGGLRYFANRAVNHTFVDIPVWGDLFTPANATFVSKENKPLFKINASYKTGDHSLAYATVSQGYRRGGSNAVPTTGNFAEDPAWQVYKSDFVTNYEAGIKGAANGITFDAAFFYVDWKDIQLNTATPNWGFYTVVNGDKAQTYGLESRISGKITGRLRYSLGYTYTHAELKDDLVAPTAAHTLLAAAGSELPGTPEHAITLALDHTRPLSNGLTLSSHLSGSYQSSTRNALGGPRFNTELEGFTIWNGSLAVSNAKWTLTGYVKNIFNDPGITGEFTEAYMGTSPAQGYYGNGSKKFISLPRTLGLTLDLNF